MKGLLSKKFSTIVMDGSDVGVVDNIAGIICMLSDRGVLLTRRSLDKEHPTMVVIEAPSSKLQYSIAEEIIERNYPGLCCFNQVV